MRPAVLLIALLALPAAAFSSCGGNDADVQALLEGAFDKQIESAVVSADLELKIEGVEALSDPIRLKVSGPYRSGGKQALPVFDFDVSFAGGGQTIAGGLLSTSENVFVSFGGTAYELGERAVASFNRDLASPQGEQRSLSQFGVDPAAWLSEVSDKGDEDVAGVGTTHLRAEVDIPRMLNDLNTLVDRAGGAVTGAGPPPKLSEEQRRQVAEAVSDPVIDVYVGREDGIIRRLAMNLGLEVPEASRGDVGGIEGGHISFSIEFADVGRPVRVQAPRKARPLAELSRQLGGLSALGAGALPEGSGAGAGGDEEAFGSYTRCLEKADPSDLPAIQACSDLLR